MDNVIIATPDNQELHNQITSEFLATMKKESLFLKLEKCYFVERQVEFLGYIIDQGTIRINPSKKHGLEEWPRELKSVKEVCSMLGVLGYQHQFILNFAHIAQPLTALLKKGTKFQWSQACTNAVDALIDCVTHDPVLQRPDTTRPFVLEVDASQYASGAILYQPDKQGRLRPVAYYSRTFNGAERNYDIHDRELLTIMRGLEQW
jgi:RNase H-like domain found in reverse transcriptase